MHDPLTVAFEIRRPWPKPAEWRTKQAAREGIRWRFNSPFCVLAGRGLYFPSLITIWHREPGGHDGLSVCSKRVQRRDGKWRRTRGWRWHVHHWKIQIHPLQQLRRRLFTRCEVCGGRSTKTDSVNFSQQWDRPRGHWWQGETGLAHMECRGVRIARDPSPADSDDFDVEVD